MAGHRLLGAGVDVEGGSGANVVVVEEEDCELDAVEFFLISSSLFFIHNFNKYFFSISSEGYID